MKYYQIIDGKKFDRQLIELAESLVDNRGDGRISENDAQQVAQALCDSDAITAIEKDTLQYLLDNFNWTDAAIDWLKTNAPIIPPEDFDRAVKAILRKYDVGKMMVMAGQELVGTMNCRYSASVSFLEALDKALENIFSTSVPNTPRGEIITLINNIYELYEEDFVQTEKWNQFVNRFLQERMNEGFLRLLPIYEEIPEDDRDFNTPDNGEPTEAYWIFFLGIRTDDHLFWTIVHRNGAKPTLSYGIN